MEVALAAIGLAVTAVGALAYNNKFMVEKLTGTLEENTKASVLQAEASKQVYDFMKNLNGKLEDAYIKKREELDIGPKE